jgi:putative restriction endonuclease
MTKDLSYYAGKFINLKVDRSRGIALHKPILLMSVIELIGKGEINDNQIFLTPELIATFLKYWSHLAEETHEPKIYQPFFHLNTSNFWHLQLVAGLDIDISNSLKPKSIKGLQTLVEYAYLDNELFSLLQDTTSRSYLINVLANKWFSNKLYEVESLLQINEFQEFQNRLREKGGTTYSVSSEEVQNEEKAVIRDAGFRKVVVSIYEYRCALCHLQIIDSLGQNIVDASHIKPFKIFFDDHTNNGLSLCKNHHWAFDRGWFAIDDNYRVLVANDLMDESPNGKTLQSFKGEPIILPNHSLHIPRLEALQWHRETIFNIGDRKRKQQGCLNLS